jgi:hypothetical protein
MDTSGRPQSNESVRPIGPTNGRRGERRRRPRQPVAWPAALWIDERCVVPGTTLDASADGAQLSFESLAPAALAPGQRRYVQIWPAGASRAVSCIAVVRYLADHRIGFEIVESLGTIPVEPPDPDVTGD